MHNKTQAMYENLNKNNILFLGNQNLAILLLLPFRYQAILLIQQHRPQDHQACIEQLLAYCNTQI